MWIVHVGDIHRNEVSFSTFRLLTCAKSGSDICRGATDVRTYFQNRTRLEVTHQVKYCSPISRIDSSAVTGNFQDLKSTGRYVPVPFCRCGAKYFVDSEAPGR